MELYIYVLLIFLNRIQGNLSQDGCKHMVLRRLEGKALNNFVFKKMKTDQDFCKALCYMDDRCLSINYITENQTCELSESDHVISPEHWVARPGSVYYRAENNCSCSGNETCRYNYELNSFQCTATASSPTSTPSPTTHPGTTSAAPTSSPECQLDFPRPSQHDYVKITSTPSPTTHP
ncbi:uncharacterized protein LOC110248444, partial [Exaiptasia diaphana]|uniref:Apple domain-containing protein n=1 Tax=Exaiptasia diaphana TaxID=2652724 RepID=A0A913XVT8_EXADI